MPTTTETEGRFESMKRFLDQLADILQNQVARLLVILAGLTSLLIILWKALVSQLTKAP